MVVTRYGAKLLQVKMAGGTEESEKPVPLDLHMASVSELMTCGQFSKEVVEAIIRTRGPEGDLTMDKLVAATGIEEESWVSLVRDGVVDLKCADFQAAEKGDSRSDIQTGVLQRNHGCLIWWG